jgi:hypothetical protein
VELLTKVLMSEKVTAPSYEWQSILVDDVMEAIKNRGCVWDRMEEGMSYVRAIGCNELIDRVTSIGPVAG